MTDEDTMTTLTTAALRKTVEVHAPSDRAYEAWWDLAAWWPLGTHAVADAATTVVVDRRPGGQIAEVAADGTQHPWGEVLVDDPPHRLVFTFGRWRPEVTEVEVRFTDLGDSRTRIDLEHRAWERLGEQAAEVRERYVTGWDPVLAAYVEHAGA